VTFAVYFDIAEAKRKEAALAHRKPQTLAEMFTGEYEDWDDDGCLICHL